VTRPTTIFTTARTKMVPKKVSRGPFYLVALAERYSQRPDLTRRLDSLHKLAGQASYDEVAQSASKPRSLRFRMADVQRQALVDDYVNGTPTTELTSRYQLSKGSVLQILEAAGVQMRRQGLTDDQVHEAVKLYTSGLSLAAIAGRLDSASTTVNRALVAQGVILRGRHDRTKTSPGAVRPVKHHDGSFA